MTISGLSIVLLNAQMINHLCLMTFGFDHRTLNLGFLTIENCSLSVLAQSQREILDFVANKRWWCVESYLETVHFW